ncbi:hypothetical protein CANCADRAFT_86708 [Tortispora caseinolytica NRRL Y-17796]|uniref:NADP-dependent oxidoreductase domain-containing protein n=1 Tax=Tortispora caseinolytica NRRL Y-17796 TaxID=767744 RepID=A0A1E4TL00_9ASCO|nr:hypothetical protein CANCADRAFT_86708 [Tortispora caseinolytica NRRL Y-17796]
MASVKLSSGYSMPLVGYGLWKVDTSICADQVYNVLKAGYRLLDGAQDYGNEKEAGEGLKRAIDDGIVKREEVFVTSKLWNSYHDPKHVEKMCRRSLADWGLEYFDLFHIHFPIAQKYVDPEEKYPPTFYCGKDVATMAFENVPLLETWKAMESLVDKGLVRSIGLSNCQGSIILDLLRGARIPPAVLQIEHHPYLTQPALLKLAKQKNIAVTGYSSFGPQSFLELKSTKAENVVSLFKHPLINEIAAAHGRTTAQVLLRWATQNGVAVIPKSSNPARLAENFDVTSFDLTEQEINAISGLDIGLRFNDPADWPEPTYIFA